MIKEFPMLTLPASSQRTNLLINTGQPQCSINIQLFFKVCNIYFFCAGRETRTLTSLRTRDFKSLASTIPPSPQKREAVTNNGTCYRLMVRMLLDVTNINIPLYFFFSNFYFCSQDRIRTCSTNYPSKSGCV